MSLEYFNPRKRHARRKHFVIIRNVASVLRGDVDKVLQKVAKLFGVKDATLIVAAIVMVILFLVIYFTLPGPGWL